MNQSAVLRLLRARVRHSSQAQVARDLDVSLGYLHDVLKGRKSGWPKIYRALGITRRVVYEHKGE